jgi:hypothetical protein
MKLELLIVAILIVILIIIIVRSSSKCEAKPPMSSIQEERFGSLPDERIVKEVSGSNPQKSETVPVFMRHDHRIIVSAPAVAESKTLPREFDARKAWPNWITPVMDQGPCGSCWAFSSSSIFSDRLKIASGGKKLNPGDYMSPHYLAACMKCPNVINSICKNVCTGNYIDDVLKYLAVNGSYSIGAINANNGDGTQYICFRPSRSTRSVSPLKAHGEYRVNPFTPGDLQSPSNLATNERTIMNEIVTHGPVTATIKVFNPMTSGHRDKNFYLYKNGVFGANWNADPKESDGYHAITIIGYGEEIVGGAQTKFWLIRNSWGTEWGFGGYGKVLKGKNRAIVESDVWALNC